jgi:hypothetical protein
MQCQIWVLLHYKQRNCCVMCEQRLLSQVVK